MRLKIFYQIVGVVCLILGGCAKVPSTLKEQVKKEIEVAQKAKTDSEQKPKKIEILPKKIINTDTSSILVDGGLGRGPDLWVTSLRGTIVQLSEDGGRTFAMQPLSASPVASIGLPCLNKIIIAYSSGKIVVAETYSRTLAIQFRMAGFSLGHPIKGLQISPDLVHVMVITDEGAFVYKLDVLLNWFEKNNRFEKIHFLSRRGQDLQRLNDWVSKAPSPQHNFLMQESKTPLRLVSGGVWFLNQQGFMQKMNFSSNTIEGSEKAEPIGIDIRGQNPQSIDSFYSKTPLGTKEKLLIISGSGEAMVYDVASGEKITSFSGNTWKKAAFSYQGDKVLLIGSQEASVINLQNYREEFLLKLDPQDGVVFALFGKDGKTIYTLSELGNIFVYEAEAYPFRTSAPYCEEKDILFKTGEESTRITYDLKSKQLLGISLPPSGSSNLVQHFEKYKDTHGERFKFVGAVDNQQVMAIWTPQNIEFWSGGTLTSLSFPKKVIPMQVYHVSSCMGKSICLALIGINGEVYITKWPTLIRPNKKLTAVWKKVTSIPKEYATSAQFLEGRISYTEPLTSTVVTVPLFSTKSKNRSARKP